MKTKHRKKPTSATRLSLALLARHGYTAGVVERRLPHAFITHDLFGFADIVAMKVGKPFLLAVQTTVGSAASKRVEKILRCPGAHEWLATGVGQICVHAWSLRGPRGKIKRWQCRVTTIVPKRGGLREGTVEFFVIPQRTCLRCGCTESTSCQHSDGTCCHWVGPVLCSACETHLERAWRLAQKGVTDERD